MLRRSIFLDMNASYQTPGKSAAMAISVFGADFGKAQCDAFASLLPHPALPAPRDHAGAEGQLPADLPDYMVYVTRNALLAGTGTMSQAWTEIYKFFVRLSWLLTLERMTREMLAFQRAINPFAALFPAPSAMSVFQPWLTAGQSEMPLLPFWGENILALPKALPKPEGGPAKAASSASKTLPASLVACAAMLGIPATLLAAMPMIADLWPATV
jgi:hypothetical protein